MDKMMAAAAGTGLTERPGAPRRRPSAGGYARGDETRTRIVAAALKVFGEDGYEGASTRRIAEVAAVKPPALQYYFDSKEGLHRACAETILASAAALFETMAGVDARLEREGAASAVEGVCAILDVLVDLAPGRRNDPSMIAFLARAQGDDGGPALRILEGRLTTPLRQLLARLVGSALGASPDDADVKLTALTVLAQVSAFQTARAKTLSFLGWPDLDGERREKVRDILYAQTRAILEARIRASG